MSDLALPQREMADAELLAASAAGDTGSFTAFMRRHQAALVRYVAIFSGSADVDDAVQETFVSAWRSAGTFRGDTGARGWLYTIARHSVHRQRRRRVDEPAHVESLEELAERAGWGSLPATEPAAASAHAELLHEALARLPHVEREVLTLRELDGFSGDETAELLQLSLPAMKSRLHRARLHLVAIARALAEEDRQPSRTLSNHSGGTS